METDATGSQLSSLWLVLTDERPKQWRQPAMPFEWKINEAPVPDKVDGIIESINRFWEDHHDATIKVLYGYNRDRGTMGFSLNIKGGDYLCYVGVVDTFDAHKIVALLDEIRTYARAV